MATDSTIPDNSPQAERARALAKETVTNRLALISALIWLGIVTVLYLFVWLPQGTKGSVATLISIGLLVVAALPWLAYRPLVTREIGRRQANPQ